MLDPKGISVLGFTHNDSDVDMLESALQRFNAATFNVETLAQSSADFPAELKSQLENRKPDIGLIQIANLEEAARFICLIKQLAKEMGLLDVYWVAVTSNASDGTLTEQLGELAVESVFFAPFTEDQITVNLCTGFATHQEQSKLKLQYEQAYETAKTAMEAASEIGFVMQLVDNLSHAATYEEVSNKLFRIFTNLGIKAYLQVFDGHDTYVFSTQSVTESVQHILSNAMVSDKRIIEHKRLILIRLNYIVLMVANAPWEDSSRYGRIKDLICQMAPVLEGRIRTIMVNNLIEEQHEKVMSIMNLMRQASSDTQNNTRAIMQNLSEKLEIAAMSLDLNEQQEEHLLGLSTGALDSLELLYMANDALEGHFLTLMDSLTRVRELTNEQIHGSDSEEDDDETGDSVELF